LESTQIGNKSITPATSVIHPLRNPKLPQMLDHLQVAKDKLKLSKILCREFKVHSQLAHFYSYRRDITFDHQSDVRYFLGIRKFLREISMFFEVSPLFFFYLFVHRFLVLQVNDFLVIDPGAKLVEGLNGFLADSV